MLFRYSLGPIADSRRHAEQPENFIWPYQVYMFASKALHIDTFDMMMGLAAAGR